MIQYKKRSSLGMADFSDFRLGENVYELSGELLPDMAAVFEIELGEEPDAQALGALVDAIGSKKTLRENESGAKAWLTQVTGSEDEALDMAAYWMDRSGVQKALNRSLWTPEVPMSDVADIVVTGGVANWQDRAASLLEGVEPHQVFVAAGDQVMNSVTEKLNPNVIAWERAYGKFPRQYQYAEDVIVPRLRAAGHEVYFKPYDTDNGDEIAARFVDEYQQLLAGDLAFARVANAGIQLAAQFRKAARAVRPDFDRDPTQPQAYVLTDTFEIARTLEQAKPENAKDYQNPFTGIRQVALTGKLLFEAAG